MSEGALDSVWQLGRSKAQALLAIASNAKYINPRARKAIKVD
ncbi:MAG: hypothetical protein AAF438_01820 [Pseudomonadota bacterium]